MPRRGARLARPRRSLSGRAVLLGAAALGAGGPRPVAIRRVPPALRLPRGRSPHAVQRRLPQPEPLLRPAARHRRLLGQLTLLVVLVVYARRGPAPDARVGRRADRHGDAPGHAGLRDRLAGARSRSGWSRSGGNGVTASPMRATSARSSRASSGWAGEFLFVSLALLVAMGLAGLTRRWWWVGAAPLFAALALLSSYLSVYLIPEHRARCATRRRIADVRSLARIEGIPGTKAEVQDVAPLHDGAQRRVRRLRGDPPGDPLGHAARRPLRPAGSPSRDRPRARPSGPPPHPQAGRLADPVPDPRDGDRRPGDGAAGRTGAVPRRCRWRCSCSSACSC